MEVCIGTSMTKGPFKNYVDQKGTVSKTHFGYGLGMGSRYVGGQKLTTSFQRGFWTTLIMLAVCKHFTPHTANSLLDN